MKQLSALDAAFLHLETPEMPMHVGALHEFELPIGFKGNFTTALRRHIESRLPIAPGLRRQLAALPLNLANPAWVPAVPDLKAHIVTIKLPALPKGSTAADEHAALEALVGELHPQLLDRSRPLWKFHVIEGLRRGPNKARRVGLYTQLHHAAVDGQAAVALANAIMDIGPEPRDIEVSPKPAKRFRLGTTQMLGGMLRNELKQYGSLVRTLPDSVGALTQMAKQGLGGLADNALDRLRKLAGIKPVGQGAAATVSNLGLAPRTVLNGTVSTRRAFATISLPLIELKLLRRTFDASLNDVVLMVCSGALRRWMEQRRSTDGTRLPKASLVAAVPVSVRAAGDTAANNQASMTLIKLGTHLATAPERIAFVKAASASMKANLGSVKTLMPLDFPSLGLPWLMHSLTQLYGRAKVAEKIPPLANVVISNVPGPAFALYMAGARMLTNYPTSIVVHGMALNITVQTYNNVLDVGLIACGEAMPDVAVLAHAMRAEVDALLALT